MDCREARKSLMAFVDDELDAPASYEVDRHLAACSCCRAEAESIRAYDRRVREACCGASAKSPECEAARGDAVSVFVGRRLAGFVGRLRGADRSEQEGAFEVVKLRCPAGSEYVLVAPPGEAEEARAAVRPQIGR